MTGETSWTDCATQVMEGKEQVWFTVQAIVTEIRETNMKPSMHHMPANEACRSLRSCLRHHARKENGRFVRKNSSTLIQYALRKGLQSKETCSGRKPGRAALPPDPAPQPPPGGAVVVEVEDADLHRPQRPRPPREPAQPGFLLPSPSQSLLGARRTLTLLSGGEAGARPVRKTRGRGPRERAKDKVQSKTEAVLPPFTNSCLPQAETEELGDVLSRDNWSIAFLNSRYPTTASKADQPQSPSHVQGDRTGCMLCEVDPDFCVTSDLSSSCEESDTDTYSEDETTPTEVMEATPTTNGPMSPVPSPHKPALASIAAASRRSEVVRQLAQLLSPSSPLVGENLKVLLGIGAFEALLPAQQLVLMELLPLVDRPLSGRLQPVALSNSFFGSACREWQDQLALSLHGNTAGRRGEKKNRNVSWKNSFFESEWGERQLDAEKREAIFFPCDPNPPFSQCLSAILSGYHSKSVPPSPSPPLPGPSHPAHQRMVPEETGRLNNSSKRSGKPQTLHSQPPSTPKTKREALQSRNCSRLPSPAKRAPGKNHLVLCNKKKVNKSMFLSPLPHKMSYAALIDALHKASQQSSPHHLAVTSDPSPPAQHSHSVFHDHFSTLRASSVPTCFLSSPLLVSLPRSLLTNLLRQRAISSEHNYTPFTSDPHLKSLPLSLPRAFLPSSPPSHSSAACSSQRLTLCSTCNALYHLDCSHGNLCPSCTMPRTTPLC